MKRIERLYLIIIFAGTSLAMQQQDPLHSLTTSKKELAFVKKRPGYTHHTDTEKVSFMGLIQRLLPKNQKKQSDNMCDIKHTAKKKMRETPKSSSPGLFDLQPINTDDMRMLTNEDEVRYDYFMAEVEGRN